MFFMFLLAVKMLDLQSEIFEALRVKTKTETHPGVLI